MRRFLIRCLSVAVLLVVVAPEAGALEPRSQALAARVRVRIVDNRFRPRSITIPRGTVVRWVNRGGNNHTVTSDTGLWDSGILLTGDAFRRRFRRRGTFEYHCEIHPSMTGTVTVTRN